MTTFTLGTRVDQRAPRTLTEAEYLQPAGNLLLELERLERAHAVVTMKRSRIVARLDDPAIAATEAQRMEAEVIASKLLYEADRHLKEFRRKAVAFAEAWGEMPEELQVWTKTEAFPMPDWDGIAAIVGTDRELMRLPEWTALIVGRDDRKQVAA